MKICAIICEYNPLHDGHIMHINATKKTGADAVLCLMSGNFVQRGEPAILDKYFRAKQAVEAGADIVIELPTAYALMSAEGFAYHAVHMLCQIDEVKFLSFGSESGQLDKLEDLAKSCVDRQVQIEECLQKHLSLGLAYGKAWELALSEELGQECAKISVCPNNKLGLEYLKALIRCKSDITPHTIKRVGAYHAHENCDGFLSAEMIRKMLKNQEFSELKKCQKNSQINAQIQQFLSYTPHAVGLDILLRHFVQGGTNTPLSQFYGVTEGIDNLLYKNSAKYESFFEAIEASISRRYTRTKLQRICMYFLLNITKERMQKMQSASAYFNVLAIKKDRLDLLDLIPNSITCGQDCNKFEHGDNGILLQTDRLAHQLYWVLCGKSIPPFVQRLQKV